MTDPVGIQHGAAPGSGIQDTGAIPVACCQGSLYAGTIKALCATQLSDTWCFNSAPAHGTFKTLHATQLDGTWGFNFVPAHRNQRTGLLQPNPRVSMNWGRVKTPFEVLTLR